MKSEGALLMLCGAGLALFGFAMDTSVHSIGTYIGGSYIGGGDTYNLGLLQQQMMVFQGGLALFVAGAIFYGSGERATNAATTSREWEEPETYEERDEREARGRRRLLITFAVLGAAAIAALLLLNWDSAPSSSYGTMNVDENLTTTDLNGLDDNLAGSAAK